MKSANEQQVQHLIQPMDQASHSQCLTWFEQFVRSDAYTRLQQRPVAYFSTEFALSNIPIYAGGLGVLAGDIVREAADRKFPLIGIGLYCHEGYISQEMDTKGAIVESSKITRPEEVGLTPLVDKDNKRIFVTVPIADRHVTVQAWEWKEGGVSVYLLDTNVAQNSISDQAITNRLYISDRETRFKQEIVLGLGGIRVLEAMDVHPSIYHMNEGHSAMLALDLVRHEMQEKKIGFFDAINIAKQHIVFTNHTLVSAGHGVFSDDLVSLLVSLYAQEMQVPPDAIVNLGKVQESSTFSMTMLSLRIAAKSNTVSELHQQKALEIWKDHRMENVTNGIHLPTWDVLQSEEDVWRKHQVLKKQLLAYIAKTTGVVWGEEELLLGWGRRFVQYKRPLALFEDIERYCKVALIKDKPIRIVLSGLAHSGDKEGTQLFAQLKELINNKLADSVVYLPNYDMAIAKMLTSGCDVWLNTPVVGFEACGTSGMKAALNGVLPCSTNDGWVSEVDLFGIGWVLNSDTINKSLLDIMYYDIAPLYYDNTEGGWERHARNARKMAIDKFSATRMLKEYIEKMYLPVIEGINH